AGPSGGTHLAAIGPAGAREEDAFGIVFELMDADLRHFQGGVEAEVVAAREEPVADRVVHPAADPADDLADADGGNAKQRGDVGLFEAPSDDEAVDIEVTTRRNFEVVGHGRISLGAQG